MALISTGRMERPKGMSLTISGQRSGSPYLSLAFSLSVNISFSVSTGPGLTPTMRTPCAGDAPPIDFVNAISEALPVDPAI